MPTSQEVRRKPESKVTSKDVPGSGLAKKAAKGIEAYRAKQRELLHNI